MLEQKNSWGQSRFAHADFPVDAMLEKPLESPPEYLCEHFMGKAVEAWNPMLVTHVRSAWVAALNQYVLLGGEQVMYQEAASVAARNIGAPTVFMSQFQYLSPEWNALQVERLRVAETFVNAVQDAVAAWGQ